MNPEILQKTVRRPAHFRKRFPYKTFISLEVKVYPIEWHTNIMPNIHI